MLDTISKNLNFKIYRDMTLVAKIGDNMFFLDQDELIDDVLAREEK